MALSPLELIDDWRLSWNNHNMRDSQGVDAFICIDASKYTLDELAKVLAEAESELRAIRIVLHSTARAYRMAKCYKDAARYDQMVANLNKFFPAGDTVEKDVSIKTALGGDKWNA